jgi:fused signal recognition particle receptor
MNQGGLWQRIKKVALTDVGVLMRGGVSDDTLQDFERVLLEADLGPATFDIVEELESAMRKGTVKTETAFREWLVDRITGLVNGAEPWHLAAHPSARPGVVVVVGVNGVGKTTQVAKIAHRLIQEGQSVLLAAADTYRAGAIEQLRVWADRLHLPCVTGTPGGDPAAVAYDAMEAAWARNVDTVIVDTAGRLHTQADLMTELQKVVRVIGRRRESAPDETLLVLDGTVGQNALQQGRLFANAVPLTGLIVTKMDGTAKGGAVVALRRELNVPVRFLGVGEGVEDLEVFDPRRYAERLVGD